MRLKHNFPSTMLCCHSILRRPYSYSVVVHLCCVQRHLCCVQLFRGCSFVLCPEAGKTSAFLASLSCVEAQRAPTTLSGQTPFFCSDLPNALLLSALTIHYFFHSLSKRPKLLDHHKLFKLQQNQPPSPA